MKKISILGVLLGGIADIVATNVFAFPLILYVMIARVDFFSMSPDKATIAVTNTIQGDWLLFTTQLLIGSSCSILGGYLAALIAKHDELLNGALSAYLCVAIGIYSVAKGIETGSVFLVILGFILSPALGLLSGYLRLLQVRPKRLRTNPNVVA